jgi:hypothetical protein
LHFDPWIMVEIAASPAVPARAASIDRWSLPRYWVFHQLRATGMAVKRITTRPERAPPPLGLRPSRFEHACLK